MIAQRLVAAVVGLALLAACSNEGAAQEPPPGPVVDDADILPPEEEALLDRHLRAYYADYGTAIVVASVTSLEGRTIEDFAFETFNRWGIGDPETRRGLLILVAPDDRLVRIEVGCGLESVVTDAFAAEVIENAILPEFTTGDYPGGLDAGIDMLAEHLTDNPDSHAMSDLCLLNERQAA